METRYVKMRQDHVTKYGIETIPNTITCIVQLQCSVLLKLLNTKFYEKIDRKKKKYKNQEKSITIPCLNISKPIVKGKTKFEDTKQVNDFTCQCLKKRFKL